jgi:hypothetical protein
VSAPVRHLGMGQKYWAGYVDGVTDGLGIAEAQPEAPAPVVAQKRRRSGTAAAAGQTGVTAGQAAFAATVVSAGVSAVAPLFERVTVDATDDGYVHVFGVTAGGDQVIIARLDANTACRLALLMDPVWRIAARNERATPPPDNVLPFDAARQRRSARNGGPR